MVLATQDLPSPHSSNVGFLAPRLEILCHVARVDAHGMGWIGSVVGKRGWVGTAQGVVGTVQVGQQVVFLETLVLGFIGY